jgi:hypothetical protein
MHTVGAAVARGCALRESGIPEAPVLVAGATGRTGP